MGPMGRAKFVQFLSQHELTTAMQYLYLIVILTPTCCNIKYSSFGKVFRGLSN